MLTRVIHILPKTHIRRERLLPINGRVIVRAGQRVTSADILAETRLDARHLILDVGKGLGVSPEKADELIVRKTGDQVAEGDIIAGPVGSFISRTVRAPKAGRIAAMGDGEVLLELEGTLFQLRAGFSGVVTELIAERGAVIENNGAIIQGVWGNNHQESGILIGATSGPNDELNSNRLDISMRGGVVFGGFCGQAEIFRIASEIPLRGLILASMTPDLIPLANQVPYPVLIIEGFGKFGLDSAAYKILSSHDKKEIFVNATSRDSFNGACPELIIPEGLEDERIPESRDSDIFAPGQTVRVFQTLNKGKIGTVVTLLPGLTGFSNGLRAPAALLRLENGEQVSLPLVNLEIID